MRGGIRERVLQATAATYVVSPAALAATGADPERTSDHLSARYLVALAGRVVREVGEPCAPRRSRGEATADDGYRHRDPLPHAEDRAAFADELTAAVLELAARYHHDDGRPHRLVVAAHPKPEESPHDNA